MRHLNKKTWPYQINLSSSPRYTVEEWCKETIGEEFKDWYGFSDCSTTTFAFKEDVSMIVFKLRWKEYGNV